LYLAFQAAAFISDLEKDLCAQKLVLFSQLHPLVLRSEFTFAYKPCPEHASCPQAQGHKKA